MVSYNIDELVKQAGGKFTLVSLMQKRMRELQRGLPPVTTRRATLLETSIAELGEGKVWLAKGAEADGLRAQRIVELQSHGTPAPQKTAPTLGPGSTPTK
jgi:DNA-directed RNA polymerase subunit K/omega